MRRRILGTAVLALMANVTFAATATACLMSGDGAVHASPTAVAGGTHHQHHAASTESDEPSTESPAGVPHHTQPVPTCCKALAPCTSVVSAATVAIVPTSPGDGALIAAPGEFAPSSRLVAPDTPPPKA